ncbi:recombinase family protein [Xylella taiwanensis]|uniref:recombinase family protein n=1 Tax=Xylella taiwanensis TaxID=1444770 RepID=UPI003CCD142B
MAKARSQNVFEDKMSGTRADRPCLAQTLEMLGEGDTLAVWNLDWLGQSVKQLQYSQQIAPAGHPVQKPHRLH